MGPHHRGCGKPYRYQTTNPKIFAGGDAVRGAIWWLPQWQKDVMRHRGLLTAGGKISQISLIACADKPDFTRKIIVHFALWSRYDATNHPHKDKILSDNYFTLHNITYDLSAKMAKLSAINVKFTIAVMVDDPPVQREEKDRGSDSSVPRATWVNGNESGQLIETCAGLRITTNRKCAFAKKRLKRRAMSGRSAQII